MGAEELEESDGANVSKHVAVQVERRQAVRLEDLGEAYAAVHPKAAFCNQGSAAQREVTSRLGNHGPLGAEGWETGRDRRGRQAYVAV